MFYLFLNLFFWSNWSFPVELRYSIDKTYIYLNIPMSFMYNFWYNYECFSKDTNVYYKFLYLTYFLLIFWSNWEITLIIQMFCNYSLIQLLLFYKFIHNLFYSNFGNYCDMSERFRDFSDIISREIAWLFLILFRERLRD